MSFSLQVKWDGMEKDGQGMGSTLEKMMEHKDEISWGDVEVWVRRRQHN